MTQLSSISDIYSNYSLELLSTADFIVTSDEQL